MSLLAARSRLGRVRRGDVAIAVAAVVSEPFVEWALHSAVLHAPARLVAGRRIDTARYHAGHHSDPDNLDLVLLRGSEALASLGAITAYAGGLSIALGPLTKGARAAAVITGCSLGATALLNYEVTHYLIHCAVPKRSRRMRVLQRNHLRHHFRNEHYWFGVTNDIADRLLRTLPRVVRDVELSTTARRLI